MRPKTKARTTEFMDYTSSNSEFKENVQVDNATGRTAVKEAEQTEKPVVRIAFNEAAVTDNYTFEIKARYQNQDDADVDESSKLELNPLLKMMENDVKIEIEVASHTAATGKAPYNSTISQLRADNIKTYFIEKGIDPNRMRSFGYGETMVRNRCKRGVNCSATEHAENLRTLIKIVKGMEAERITDKGAPVETATEQPLKTNKKPLKAQNTEGGKNRSLVSNSDVGQRYYVIIGTFTRAENAQKHRKKAVDLGFVETEVVKYPDSAMYGVAVRIMSDAKEAKKLSDYINKQKEFEAFVKEVK